MLILCQKLHICTYDRQNYSGDRHPFKEPCPHYPAKVVGVLEPLLLSRVAKQSTSLKWLREVRKCHLSIEAGSIVC